MQVIHAIWEKRNLGVNCYEVTVESGDTLEMLKERALEYETDYTVIKVPTGMMDISLYLQSMGYKFMEGFTTCYHSAELPNLNSIQQRMVNSVLCEKMNDKDWDQMANEIRGGMFRDDRVSLDPFFTQDQANNRYIGWMTDEKTRSALFYKITYKDDAIGFFVIRNVEKRIYLGVISGIYPKFQKYAMGLCLYYYTIYESIKLNAKRIEQAFSTNNRGASALHLSMGGYILKEQYNVFISHK